MENGFRNEKWNIKKTIRKDSRICHSHISGSFLSNTSHSLETCRKFQTQYMISTPCPPHFFQFPIVVEKASWKRKNCLLHQKTSSQEKKIWKWEIRELFNRLATSEYIRKKETLLKNAQGIFWNLYCLLLLLRTISGHCKSWKKMTNPKDHSFERKIENGFPNEKWNIKNTIRKAQNVS